MPTTTAAASTRVTALSLPSVDVIVPCYNYGHYLGACVEGVLSQPGVDIRVHIIDDHSSDNSEDVGRSLAFADPRVRFSRHSVNRGHLATYNEGLDAATAEFLVLLSADDLLTAGALGRATQFLRAHPNVGFVYGYPIPLYTDILPRARTGRHKWSIWSGREWIGAMCESGRNLINCPEVVMRTRVQHAIGGYSSKLPHSGDMEMWMRAAAVSDVGHIDGADQAYYRIHARSMQRTVHAGALLDMQARYAAFESAFAGDAGDLPGADHLLATAKRALSLEAIDHVERMMGTGRAGTESIDAFRAFAQHLYPEVTAEPAWHRVQAAGGPMSTVQPSPLHWTRSGLHRLHKHLQWRRWRRTGAY